MLNYRDTLKRNYNLKQFWIEINLEDLGAYDESLSEKIYKQPTEYLPIFEEAATEIADELTAPRPVGEEKIEDIQILLTSEANCSSLRGMKVRTKNLKFFRASFRNGPIIILFL